MFTPRTITAGLLLAAAGSLCAIPAAAQQIAIPRIEQMPLMPSPYLMRNWKQVARGYDSLAFDLNRTGQYLPLVFLNASTVNYPGTTSFGLHSYVGDSRSQSGEAINVLPALVSGALNGVDKRSQGGHDWVVMSQEYFNNRPAEDVYLNSPASSSGSDWWYDVMPNVFFYQIAAKYPGAGDETHQFTRVADRWLQAVGAMGGSVAPWSHPGLEHQGWYLASMTPNNATPHEPEAGGSMGWILYHAWVVTGDARYRYGAELCMEELNAYSTNPAYELQLAYGTLLAARMNAEAGTAFDVEKMVNWCFNVSPIRSWGAMVGTWGGYDCAGLIGEVNGSNDYAFAMNTFEQIGTLVPLVRYDPRFARAIGKWVLNAANASRLFYPNYLPDVNQDSRTWSSQYDPQSVIAHEALRQHGPGIIAPYGTGDAIAGGWAPTNLSLYSSSHAGILGSIIDTTDVRGILKLDLLATDHFHAPAYPSYLLYNPDSIAHAVALSVGGVNADVYDAVSRGFIARNVLGTAMITIGAHDAVVAVVTPAGGSVTYDEERMRVNGVVVDYHSTNVPANHAPRIKGLGAAPSLLYLDGSATLYCTAADKDGDTLSYHWTATTGTLTGSGTSVTWKAPGVKGIYDVICSVMDARGESVAGQLSITVVDSPLSMPVITSVIAVPGKVDLGAQATVTCKASDPSSTALSYTWRASAGAFTGTDSAVVWTSPMTAGNVSIVCTVKNSVGGADAESVLVPVRDFTKLGTGSCILNIPCNGTLEDISGFGHQVNGTDITFVADRDGTSGHAGGYNGATSALRVTDTAVLNCDSAITVSFWMKPGLAANKEMFLVSHGSWQNRWKISLTPDRKIRWTVKTTAGVKDVDSRTVVASGTYYHVAGVYNGVDMEMYVNGEFENFVPLAGRMLTPAIDLMAGQMLPTDANYNFAGVIDDIAIFNYAMMPSQIRDRYHVVTGVHEQASDVVPLRTGLTGVYPNPFNPSTVIGFTVGKATGGGDAGQVRAQDVRVVVYDILGREVALLASGAYLPGRYTVTFDARQAASGVYICRFTAGTKLKAHGCCSSDEQLYNRNREQETCTMKSIDLTGAWQFRCEDTDGVVPRSVRNVARWMPATVPGTVHTDLMAAGKIPDPFHMKQELDVQWVDSVRWTYRTTFRVPESLLRESTIVLVAEGLDTFATISINGKQVGTSSNMFIGHTFDVRSALVAGKNEIEIGFDSPEVTARALEKTHGKLEVPLVTERVYTRKPQYSYGWDWGPKLTTSGIWLPIRIEAWSGPRLRHPAVRVDELAIEGALLVLSTGLEGIEGQGAELEVLITGQGDEVRAQTPVEGNGAMLSCLLQFPQLWWPNGLGEQPLYTAVFTLRNGDTVLDTARVVFGVRTVRLLQDQDEEGRSFIIEINGRKVFCKGADWIPADTFVPRIPDSRYERLLTLARDASMNMIRIWGGGIYEKEIFYETCDRLGLMVWQDFMFACAEYPEYPSFLKDVQHEAEEVVLRLRNHPSIVLWCGNNECEWGYCTNHPGSVPDKMHGATIFRDLLPQVVQTLDGTRPYWRSTPFGDGFPNDDGNGNHHEWDVWSFWKDYTAYRKVNARFVAEFGFQAPPDRRTMERVIDPADRTPQSAVMEFHNKQVEGPERLFRFMAAHFPVPTDWASFFHTGQLLQAEALRCGVEHWRRRKYRTAGALFWQLNDCWPVTSWSVVDSDLRPKAGYYYAKRFYAQTLVSFADHDGGIAVWGTHDGDDTIEGRLVVKLRTLKGAILWRETVPVTLPHDSSQVLYEIPAAVLRKADPATLTLTAEIVSGKRTIAGNRHFLVEIKHLALPRVRLQCSVRSVARGIYRARIRANVAAVAVALTMDRGEAAFRDNWFTMDAGETREVEFTSASTPTAVRRAIRARALNS